MRNIAVVIPKYGLVGGAEQFASELTQRLAAAGGDKFHVFANRWQTASAAISFHKIPVISFPKFLTTVSFAYFVRRQLRKNIFSLVHSHERIFAADIFTLHGIPHRYWVRHIRRKKMSLYDLATDWVEKKLVEKDNCKKYVAVSNLTKDIFLKEYSVDSAKVVVINPGVDLNEYAAENKEFCRREIREEYGIGPDEPVILFASMNFEIKGLDAIILALARLKARNLSFKFLVVGKGNSAKYEKMARQAGIANELRFTGQASREKMIKMYLAGDIYIMLSKFDTFGMVVLEAMAAGLPVIISGNVGARDLVREGKNGFVVNDPSDANYVAAKIEALLDENIRRAMVQAAYQTAKQNTWELVAAKYQEIYAKVFEQRGFNPTL